MSDADPTAQDETAEDVTDAEMEAYDVDHDGKIGIIDRERAQLGLVDARLEEIAHDGGIKGKLADAAHHLLDKIDND